MIIVGEKEEETNTLSVRSRKDGELGEMSIADFTGKILTEIATKAR